MLHHFFLKNINEVLQIWINLWKSFQTFFQLIFCILILINGNKVNKFKLINFKRMDLKSWTKHGYL